MVEILQWRKCQTLYPRCTLFLNFGEPVTMQCKLAAMSGQADWELCLARQTGSFVWSGSLEKIQCIHLKIICVSYPQILSFKFIFSIITMYIHIYIHVHGKYIY